MDNRKSFNEEDYIDEVGGYHSPCNCYNPKGYFCGDCTKLSCKDCEYRNYTNSINEAAFEDCYFRPDEFISFEGDISI